MSKFYGVAEEVQKNQKGWFVKGRSLESGEELIIYCGQKDPKVAPADRLSAKGEVKNGVLVASESLKIYKETKQNSKGYKDRSVEMSIGNAVNACRTLDIVNVDTVHQVYLQTQAAREELLKLYPNRDRQDIGAKVGSALNYLAENQFEITEEVFWERLIRVVKTSISIEEEIKEREGIS